MIIHFQFSEALGAFHRNHCSRLVPYWSGLSAPVDQWQELLTRKAVSFTNGDKAHLTHYGLAIHTQTPPTVEAIKQLRNEGVDVNSFPKKPSMPRLATFDMDATLVNEETLDVLAERWLATQSDANAIDAALSVQKLTRLAMQGVLSFGQSLRARLTLLRGLPETLAHELIQEGLPFHHGVPEFFAGLHQRGCATVLATSGFQPFALAVKKHLNMDAIHTNRWQLDQKQTLTGSVQYPMVDAWGKQRALLLECKKRGVAVSDTMAVGDGANDLRMLQSAGLGVAWRAKPILQAQIPVQLHHAPMSAILDWF